MDTTELARDYSIADYKSFKASKDTQKIANLIYQRFYERYISPFENNEKRHGFSMMAVSCLMIEAFQSFKEGENESEGKVFERFFQNSTHFKNFESTTFYKNIRCGILHQAETTGGWRIWQVGELLNNSIKTINARLFIEKLNDELKSYCNSLMQSDYNSDAWVNALKKLDYICKNSCDE